MVLYKGKTDTTVGFEAMSQARAVSRRESILDAALRIFSKHGYSRASMDAIADESQTSRGGVYFHFPNREAIFIALLNRTTQRLTRKIGEALSSHDDPVARADAALYTVMRTFSRHRGIARLLMMEGHGLGRDFSLQMDRVRAGFSAIIQREIEEAVRTGIIEPVDSEVTATAWFGALNEVITRWALSKDSPRSLEESYATLRTLLMRSVGVDSRRDGLR